MSIRELDDETVRQIAAGEVVERPASAVKELVENSLDADASRIDVAVEAGGTEGIRIADDGVGMTREELRLAVQKHTTSKIADAEDLASVRSLGFRGEALHAIGSVSRLTITTKPRSADGAAQRDRGGDASAAATELAVEFGRVGEPRPAGRPAGTTVEVADLFAETPARRKFLKAESTEFDHVNRVVTRYAIANPDVAISLAHDGREVFSTDGGGDRRAALLAVYGREVAESMIRVEGEGVSGHVSHPETTRSTRDYLGTYVNGRAVSATALREAILDAYGAQLAPDRYPFAAIFVEVPPDRVDVNVHPRKLEVRFDDEAAVRERVRTAIEGALVDHGLVRHGAPRGASAPAEAAVSPSAPGSTADSTATDGHRERDPAGAEVTESSGATSVGPSSVDGGPAEGVDGAPVDDEAGSGDTDWAAARGEPGTQRTLDAGRADERTAFESLPSMRILGQLEGTYVVAEGEDGLLLIDQHAADERIHYERLRERLGDEPDAQVLADPVTVELTAREAALLDAHADALSALGFRTTALDDRAVEVRAVPAVLAAPLSPTLVPDVLGEVVREREAGSVEARADAILADLACHPAITGNTTLTEGSIRALLSALDDCENPYACPHGRPVVVEIDAAEIATRFERDYPGHGGRRRE